MKIHPKGISVILLFMMLVILIISLLTALTSFDSTYNVLIWSAGGIFVLLFSMFFRYPVRKPFHNTNAILSAADGKVVAIEKVYEKEFFLKEMQVISVFMSIYDVHVNFLPIDGKIVYTKHHPGKNYPAINPKSSELNEMYSTVIKNDRTSILVRQIAGIAARRIHVSVSEEDNVTQGDELGLIKLGSRVDIFLPTDMKVNVKLHDKVVAGQSVLAWIS
jgi:phosphatidylserine decarboxylase